MTDQAFIEMVAYEQMQAQRNEFRAQRDRALATLREIASLPWERPANIARAALAELEES